MGEEFGLAADRRSQRVDFVADCTAESRESESACHRDECGGYCIFRKLKSRFVSKKILNHGFHSLAGDFP